MAQAHGRRGDRAGDLVGEAGGVPAIVLRVEGAGLEAAYDTAYHDGGLAGLVLEEDDAAEEAGLGWVEDGLVEGVGVADGQEERVDAPQCADVRVCHGYDPRGGVGRW